MVDEESRERAALEAAQMQRTWKIQIHSGFKQKCQNYYRDRVGWEFSMVHEAASIEGVIWPKEIPMDEIIQLANPRNLETLDDYREIVEKERKLLTRD